MPESTPRAVWLVVHIAWLPRENTTVPMILMYFVALALAATVTMWIAPMSLWQKSERPDDVPSRSPAKVRGLSVVNGLQVRQEGLE